MGLDFHRWLVGFIDGDGYLGMCGEGKRAHPVLVIGLKLADEAILQTLVSRLSIGNINMTRAPTGYKQVRWQVNSKKDLLQLLYLLDNVQPFYTRKRYQYPIWRKAALDYIYLSPSKRAAQMQLAKERLIRIREFHPDIPPEESWRLSMAMQQEHDARFFSWFSGFTDAEGHFRTQQGPYASFVISQRIDNGPTLQAIQKRLQIGKVYTLTRPHGTTGRPYMQWVVHGRGTAQRFLLGVFDEYPLQTSKAHQYATWRNTFFAGQQTLKF